VSNANVETFRGIAPRCRNCNKPLRPNYDTRRRGIGDEPIRHRLAEIPGGTDRLYPPDDTTKDCEERDPGFGTIYWKAKKQAWFQRVPVDHVKSRKFLGTFGARGDNLFCKTECGYAYAVRSVRAGRLL
jgi:hypothetical protein